MNIELPQGVSTVTKKGQTYYRFRWNVGGKRQEKVLAGVTGALTHELLGRILAAVEAIVLGEANPAPKGAKLTERKNVANPGTWGLAWRIFQAEDEDWAVAADSAKMNHRYRVEDFLDSQVVEGSSTTWKEIPVGSTSRVLLEAMLKATRQRSQSRAFKLLIALRGLVRVAISKGWIKPEQDPTYMMKIKKTKGTWKAWPAHEMAAFELRHPLGSAARTAYELTKWTGQRQGDICQLRRSQIKVVRRIEGDAIVAERYFMIEQEKNAGRRQGGAKVAPVLISPMLEEAIAHIPADQDFGRHHANPARLLRDQDRRRTRLRSRARRRGRCPRTARGRDRHPRSRRAHDGRLDLRDDLRQGHLRPRPRGRSRGRARHRRPCEPPPPHRRRPLQRSQTPSPLMPSSPPTATAC